MTLTKLAAGATGAAALLFALPGRALAQDGAPEPWAIGLRDAASPVQQNLIDFHNLLLWIIGGITLLVTVLLLTVIVRFRASRNPTPSRTTHNTLLEVAWTAVPLLILAVIALKSMQLLYFMDRVEEPEMTLVATGYQWYWGHAYPDQQIDEFSSFMVEDADLQPGQVRLLSVDRPIVLPIDTNIEILVTAGDVIHSWSVPSLGVKTDAVNGRMNHTWTRIEREGTYYGVCAEICGTRHSYMPIEIHAVSREAFDDWVEQQVAGRELDEPPVLLTRTYRAPGQAPDQAPDRASADSGAVERQVVQASGQ